jgi:hypothetical protein
MSNLRRNSKTEGLSGEDLKKIMASEPEVVKQMKINEKSDHSNLSQIKHNVPILKSDNTNEYMACIDQLKGVCLATGCVDALDETHMDEVLKKLNKHDDLHKLDANDAKQAAIISAMAKNDKVMGYINSGLVMIEHRNCVSAAKSVKFPFGIAYLALKELREYYIPDGTISTFINQGWTLEDKHCSKETMYSAIIFEVEGKVCFVWNCSDATPFAQQPNA